MADQPGIIRFGVFEVNLAAGELRKNGARVKLQEQPFQVLAALLTHPGEIVTKEELKERLWAGDTFVDFDHSLSTAVNKIREALGDSASSPRFIETIPRRGYRFVGFAGGHSDGPFQSTASVIEGEAASKPSRRRWPWAAAAAVVFALAGAVLLWRRVEPVPAPVEMRAVPLTSLPGSEIFPAFSPDGTRVAFAWNGEHAGNFDIYVQVVGTGTPVRLTEDPAPDLDPSWSPDGRSLVFARQISPDRVALLRISALGGQESVITEAADPSILPVGGNHYLRWSYAGDAILFADQQAANEPFAIYLHRLESGERTRLTTPSNGSFGDGSPALSADGKTLVFMRYPSPAEGAIHVLDLNSDGTARGPSRQLVALSFFTHGPVLAPHSPQVVFARGWPESSLWRMELSGRSPPERLVAVGDRGVAAAFSADGKRLAYARGSGEWDLWRLELPAAGVAGGQPRRWIYSTQTEMHADYSPDGTKIAFQSNRSGDHQVWVSNADGSNPEQLTSLEASLTGTPRWSPDGNQIAFDSTAAGRFDIYVMSAGGAGVTRMTQGAAYGHSARWSPDGKWIYFSEGTGRQPLGLWRVPVAGGEPQKIAQDSFGRPFVSRDGRYVYHRKADGGLWRVGVEGGEETRMLETVLSNASFAVVLEGIYYTPATAWMAGSDILFHRFADGSVTTVWHSPDAAPDRFAISPDGHFLLFTLPQEIGMDLMLVEDYQ